MKRTILSRRLAACAVTFLLIGMTTRTVADLDVNLTVTDLGGGAFLYDVSISNNGTQDVSIVSIIDATAGDSLIASTLASPAGFVGSYDSGLGFVDLLESTGLFAAGTTRSGFSFQRGAAPSGNFATFEALTTDGVLLTGPINIVAPGGPSLSIAPYSPGTVTISWTPETPGFVLQESPALSPVNWTNSPSGETNPVIVPAILPAKFYRLFKP